MLDVIVPVYAGEQQTRRCLESVLAAGVTLPFELVVVDDATPERALAGWLDEVAAAGRLTLVRHEVNRGFVGAVNSGMALHPDRDVVLLNADTEVANDWLDRLAACAGSAADIGTVTPFSNNATICSYPYPGWDGGVPGRLGLAGLDRLFADTLGGRVVDLPTAVGFCMFVRRACLDAVGGFDEGAFGRGYGEENDFSRRAAKAGWRNVLAADVFVFHEGGVSFGPDRQALMREADRILVARHPEYPDLVRAFGLADPVAPLREAIDRARAAVGSEEALQLLDERRRELRAARVAVDHARRPPPLTPAEPAAGTETAVAPFFGAREEDLQPPTHAADRPALLHVAHSWGGGIDRWVHDYAASDERRWQLLLRSRTDRNAVGVRLELVDLDGGDALLGAWDLEPPIGATALDHPQYRAILDELTAAFGVEAVAVSSLLGHSLAAFDTGLPTLAVLHDLYPACPALFGWFDGACQHCRREDLERCFAGNPLNLLWHQGGADSWLVLREALAERLARPGVVLAAPGRGVFERALKLLPGLAAKTWHEVPHGVDLPDLGPIPAPSGHGRLRVVIPGRLARHKGLDLFLAVLEDLRGFAEVMLLGCGDFGLAFRETDGVTVVPDYDKASMAALLRAFGPDCALLLSELPESFSYTLSEMWALRVPVVATRLGAFVERIDDGETGFLVEPRAEAVLERLRALADDRSGLAAVRERLAAQPVRSAREMVRDYDSLPGWGGTVGEQARPGQLAASAARLAASRRYLAGRLRDGERGVQILEDNLRATRERAEAQERRADAERRRANAQQDRADVQTRRADAERARANAQEARADAQQARADGLQERVAGLTADTENLRKSVGERDARIDELAQAVSGVAAERDAVLSSTLWRATRPVRVLVESLRNLRGSKPGEPPG